MSMIDGSGPEVIWVQVAWQLELRLTTLSDFVSGGGNDARLQASMMTVPEDLCLVTNLSKWIVLRLI